MLYSTSQPSRCCPSRHFRAPPRRIQRLPLALRRTQRRRCQVVQIPLPVIRVCGSEPALPRLPGAAAARPARRSAPAASQSESSPRLGRCGAPSPSFRGPKPIVRARGTRPPGPVARPDPYTLCPNKGRPHHGAPFFRQAGALCALRQPGTECPSAGRRGPGPQAVPVHPSRGRHGGSRA